MFLKTEEFILELRLNINNANKTLAKHRDIFRQPPIGKSMVKAKLKSPPHYSNKQKKYGEVDVLPGKAQKIQTPARVRTHNLQTSRRTPYQLGHSD